MLKSTPCDCSDTYILVKEIIAIAAGAFAAAIITYRNNKKVILKDYIPLTVCISEINNIHLDHEKDLDIVMQMGNLMKYIYNYVKAKGNLWKYCTDEPNNNITGSELFKFKSKLTNDTGNAGTVNRLANKEATATSPESTGKGTIFNEHFLCGVII